MFYPFLMFVYGLVVGGVIVFFVYRNNIKKIQELQKKLTEKIAK